MSVQHPAWPPVWPEITDPLVRHAMATVPRHLFVPREYQDQAYDDAPLPIGLNQTISQPFIVALMTQALELTKDSRVLEIGTGSGYQAAVLATIASHVWSVESLPILADAARERLAGLGYGVTVQTGDGRLGWPENAPYDAIIATAAPARVPPALVQQLAEGGRLVIPVGANLWDQWLWLIRKDGAGHLSAKRLGEVRFVPFIGTGQAREDDAELRAISESLERLLR